MSQTSSNPSTVRRARRALAALAASALAGAALVVACTDPATTGVASPGTAAQVSDFGPATHIQYGAPVQVGNGRARTYVVLDQKNGGAPLELGVAFDESAMDGLPAASADHSGTGHPDMHAFVLPTPAQNPTPIRFVELDWNPVGHEPAGIYDKPHFDFHFYGISVAERNAIVPTDPQYAARAGNFPAADYVPAGYLPPTILAGAPPEAVAVPRMGMHWLSPATSPELPPTLTPFTSTFIYGTWDGRVIFAEPMVTRAYIMSKPNVTRRVAVAAKHEVRGWYPSSYTVGYDAPTKEYRVSLGGFAKLD